MSSLTQIQKNVICRLYNLVDSEIKLDFDSFLNAPNNNTYVFSTKPYFRHLNFNGLIGYENKGNDINKYILYTGGLGMGNYIFVYFDINKGYSLVSGDGDGEYLIYESWDWQVIKLQIDILFHSVNPDEF